MIVNRLNIVVLDNWSWLGTENPWYEELKGGGEALAEHYRARLNDGGSRVKLLTLVGGSGANYDPGSLSGTGFHGGDCGTYVIGHTPGFSGDTIGGLDAVKLAALLTKLGVVPVRKLCLLGCSSGYGDKDHGHKGSPQFLVRLCAELKDPNMMVAGWRHFVTIDEQGRKRVKVPYNKKDAEPVRVDAESRKSQKVAVRWNGQDAPTVNLSDWSDKGRLSYAMIGGNVTVLAEDWWGH